MKRDFIIGVVGDFSGASVRKPERFLDIDRDEFAQIFSRLEPGLDLGLPFCERLSLTEWEDWHPDGLLTRVPMLAKLLEAREAAGDPSRMRGLLAEAGIALEPALDPAAAQAATPAPAITEKDLLDDLLTGSSPKSAPVRVAHHVADPSFERLLAEIAAPHAERIDHAGIARRRDAIDAELGARMRTLLRHSTFRRCEALWHSLRALVFASETGEGLRIRILDADVDALRDSAGGELADALHRLVVTDEHGTLGGQAFGMLLVDAEIDGDDADLTLLERLGRVAGEAELACLVGAGPALWAPEANDASRSFLERARALPGASRVALCAPRLLTRIPYGRAGDPVDRFAFEEVDENTGAEGYSWGPAGFAVAQAAADAVAATGSASQTARFAQRTELPFHPRGANGDPVGPTEQVLPDSELERLHTLGILPIAGVRGRDAAVLTSLDSLTGAALF